MKGISAMKREYDFSKLARGEFCHGAGGTAK
jgi:hypothetical protein